jgi:predicted enzyme related to lactoylglutathione lyase
MANGIRLIVYPVKNLEKTKSFYNKFLGVASYVDSLYHVGYKLGSLEVGLDLNGQTVISFVDVTDINSSLQALVDAGGAILQDVTDVGGGLLIAKIKDANGNVLGFRAPK